MKPQRKKLEDGKYTDDSVAKVNEAIKNAEEVIADDQSTSDKIAEATAYLNEAVAALEVKPEEPANDDTSSDDVSTPEDTSSDDASEPDDTSSDDTSSDDTSSDDTSKGDESKVDDNITNPDTGNLVSVAPFAAISVLSAIALAGMVIPEAIKNKKSSK